jgi:riboflavin biosynthesis pyrimidine reductase
VWEKELQGLLDVILEKGCQELHVEGGKNLIRLYPGTNDMDFPEPEGTFYF